jgi:hypothetical protein
MSQMKPVNPFYIALLPVGVAFVVTACAYGVMMVQALSPRAAAPSGPIGLMDRHGLAILAAELALLGVLTVAAIASDDFWTRRFEAAQRRNHQRKETSREA